MLNITLSLIIFSFSLQDRQDLEEELKVNGPR